jgi:hypothetical protein
MEKIMSKTDDTFSNVMPLALECELATKLSDSELDTVSGGASMNHGIVTWINEVLSFRPVPKGP